MSNQRVLSWTRTLFRRRVGLFILGALATTAGLAMSPDRGHFQIFDLPGASQGTFANAINGEGDIVLMGAVYQANPFYVLLGHGRSSPIPQVPGSLGEFLDGINARFEMVGVYNDQNFVEHGFLFSDRRFSDVTGPSGESALPHAINDSGDIAGTYVDATFHSHAFVLSHGAYASIDIPNSFFTFPLGINSAGDVVGVVAPNDGNIQGFLLKKGVVTMIAFPGATITNATGINSEGEIVGWYQVSPTEGHHGFLLRAGRFITIDVPGADRKFGGTDAIGINSRGDIIGNFTDRAKQQRAFLLTEQP